MPLLKEILWGGEFWSKGFYISTVGRHGNEKMIKNYVKNQGKCSDYQTLYQGKVPKEQLTFWSED